MCINHKHTVRFHTLDKPVTNQIDMENCSTPETPPILPYGPYKFLFSFILWSS